MRHIIPLIILMFLLTGCGAEPAPSTVSATEAPTSAPTEATEIATEPTETTVPFDPMRALLDAMTVEEKVGQLFLARHPVSGATEDLSQYHLGGYILFGGDFEGHTSGTLKVQLSGYRTASAIPPLLAVDEEGGTVCRVSRNPYLRPSRFPSPRSAFQQGGMDAVLQLETEKAILLRDLGLNVNMGPVCDITTTPGAFMYDRSIGLEPEETGRFAAGTIEVYREHQLGSVLKHFPGYGNNADTHTGMARDDRSLSELESRDLIPFAMAIEAGCDAILVSHTLVTAIDETLPASLSPAVHAYLRDTMNFDGVIVTDDLVMQAITDAYGPEEAAVLAVQAGNDLLCSTDYALQYTAVLEAVNSGRISDEQLDRAVLRILAWKQRLGLIF